MTEKISLAQKAKQAFYSVLWLTVVTFPLVVMREDEVNDTMNFRWGLFIAMAVLMFVSAFLWFWALDRKDGKGSTSAFVTGAKAQLQSLTGNTTVQKVSYAVMGVVLLAFPFVFSMYNTGIMTTAFIYIILGLGLNIIIGWGGLLNLGYAAFFSIGAYTYALLFKYLGVGFWVALPVGGIVAALFGILVGFPVLRLRGDYLAIVTLAFGEIVRIVLNNLGELTGGPDGVSQIPRPEFFTGKLPLKGAIVLTYFIALALVALTIFIMRRVENSRMGRAWEAMREDEIAAESMGVDITQAKLTTFALGSFFAGIAGVVMAAKSTKVTPDSFGLMESVMVLSIVVLGGKGSIPGVVVGALILKLLPEYFRAFSSYRMLVFGLVLVIMMVFKPNGLVAKKRKIFVSTGDTPPDSDSAEGGEA